MRIRSDHSRNRMLENVEKRGKRDWRRKRARESGGEKGKERLEEKKGEERLERHVTCELGAEQGHLKGPGSELLHHLLRGSGCWQAWGDPVPGGTPIGSPGPNQAPARLEAVCVCQHCCHASPVMGPNPPFR